MSVSNREIKFRIWEIATKEFIQDNEDFCLLGNGWLYFINKYGQLRVPRISITDCENYIIQFFTGLKDKNSKEIYEGDIIRYKQFNAFEKNLKVKIGYAAPTGRRYYGLFFTDSDEIQSFDINPYEPIQQFTIEIIGNIFQNPELLK